MTTKVCIFGAGAVGCFIAAHMARAAAAEVTVVARGEAVDAIRNHGIRVEGASGAFSSRLRVVSDPAELPQQDYLFITLKTHQVSDALPSIVPLLKPNSVVIPPTTGLPYWYFASGSGAWTGRRLNRLDAGGKQWDSLRPERAIGCTFWVGAELLEPGVVRQSGEAGFPIGEPNGSNSDRLRLLHTLMTEGGLRAPMRSAIRGDVWIKLVNSIVWNPIAILTRARLGEIGASQGTVATAQAMMRELDDIADLLGVPIPVAASKRIASTLANASHRMSMLQDLFRGRPLELRPLLDSVAEVKEMTGRPTPMTDVVLSMAELASVSPMISDQRSANGRAA